VVPGAHPSPQPKQHLDWFSRFCTAHGLQWAALSPSKLPLPMGNLDLHLIHGSLSPSEAITQTVSRSVQPFLHSSPKNVSIFYNGLPPSKLFLPMGDLDPSNTWFFWANTSSQPKQHLDQFNHICRAHFCDRPTDHAAQSVTIGHIYVCHTAMRPKKL